MYFFFIIILILLSVDYIVFNETKKYINKKYRKTLNLLNRYNPLYKFEMKRSNDSFLMRMLILTLFWLSINFIFVIIEELKTWNFDADVLNRFNFFENYKYFIIPIIGLFVYFGIHVYSKNNSYIRTVDMILGIIPSLFITFIS
jgi:hypothetical protein